MAESGRAPMQVVPGKEEEQDQTPVRFLPPQPLLSSQPLTPTPAPALVLHSRETLFSRYRRLLPSDAQLRSLLSPPPTPRLLRSSSSPAPPSLPSGPTLFYRFPSLTPSNALAGRPHSLLPRPRPC